MLHMSKAELEKHIALRLNLDPKNLAEVHKAVISRIMSDMDRAARDALVHAVRALSS